MSRALESFNIRSTAEHSKHWMSCAIRKVVAEFRTGQPTSTKVGKELAIRKTRKVGVDQTSLVELAGGATLVKS
jgi:hypothetical protein